MIVQLREFYTPEQRALVYAQQYNHNRWEGHIERVARTAEILRDMEPATVADLSCGDAAIVKAAGLEDCASLGDLVPGWMYHGPIEETIHKVSPVDVFLLSETLEHVEDPLTILQLIRDTADRLLFSTPYGEYNNGNPEHYWGWDHVGISQLLALSGWSGEYELFTPSKDAYYTFQIWRCS